MVDGQEATVSAGYFGTDGSYLPLIDEIGYGCGSFDGCYVQTDGDPSTSAEMGFSFGAAGFFDRAISAASVETSVRGFDRALTNQYGSTGGSWSSGLQLLRGSNFLGIGGEKLSKRVIADVARQIADRLDELSR